MRFTNKALSIDQTLQRHHWVRACFVVVPALVSCTSQQAYEGLKAGQRSSCLEYPESEFQDCVDQSNTSYHEYQRQRDEILGD